MRTAKTTRRLRVSTAAGGTFKRRFVASTAVKLPLSMSCAANKEE